MPQRKSALTLKEICLQNISDKLELICYGAERTDPTLRTFIESGLYENIDASACPLSCLPSPLLSELLSVAGRTRPCPLHILHILIQPNIRMCKLTQTMNTRAALKRVSMRCRNLTCLDIPHYKVVFMTIHGFSI